MILGYRAVVLGKDLMEDTIETTRMRIAPYVLQTPCRESAGLGDAIGGTALLKLENLQTTGSFKLRGVVNKVLSLSEVDSQRLLVAASTGNHGAAFAHALELFGLRGKLFMPKTSSAVKIKKMRSTGVPFELVGEDCVEAEVRAHEFAQENGFVWISPYNDLDVVHGQGTVAVELVEQVGAIDAVLAPVGGGGLISGIAAYLKAVDPSIEVIGCQPVNSCVMYESIKAGEILDVESLPTVSDGTAGGIEKGSVTFDLCRRYVDDFVLLEEEEIIAAMRLLQDEEGLTVEGAAALPVAALLKDGTKFAGRRTALIISGGRVDEKTLDMMVPGS
jgi:threonine dehydratase